MRTLSLILILIATALTPAHAALADSCPPIEVNVLVLNFDPIVDATTGKRLHEEGRWNDPRTLAKGYQEDVERTSGGRVKFKVVEWRDLDEFPVKEDGFAYSVAEYQRCRKTGKGWHQPDQTDYPKVIARHKIVEKVESGQIDEVWWFGAPYFGFGESAMAGKGAFYINGPTYDETRVPCKKAFAIMGFNYERGVAEMIHDLSHRTAATMSRVFGGWRA
jgi:hypothetical protein